MEPQKKSIIPQTQSNLEDSKIYSIIVTELGQTQTKTIQIRVKQDYGSPNATKAILEQISVISKQKNITKLHWTWANSLTVEQFNFLINQLLPDTLTGLWLNGSMFIQAKILEQILNNFRKLEFLNLFCENDENWDMQLNLQGRKSIKHFRQRTKWSAKIVLTPNNIASITHKLPQTLLFLSLKNIRLSGLDNPLKLVLSSCKQLVSLDISNTQMTDENLLLPQALASEFMDRAKQLKINRNRISRKGVFSILNISEDIKDKKTFIPKSNFRTLEINQTNVSEFYVIFSKIFPDLEKLSIGTLSISPEEVQQVHRTENPFVWKTLKQLHMDEHLIQARDLFCILGYVPELEALSLNKTEASGNKTINISKFPKKLKWVDLASALLPNVDSFVTLLLEECPLQILKLSNTKISGEVLSKIANKQSKLSWLEISYLEELNLGQLNIAQQLKLQEENIQISWDKILSHILKKIIINCKDLSYCETYGLFLKSKGVEINNLLQQLQGQSQGQRQQLIKLLIDQRGILEVHVNRQKY